jgi:hypothetical protein
MFAPPVGEFDTSSLFYHFLDTMLRYLLHRPGIINPLCHSVSRVPTSQARHLRACIFTFTKAQPAPPTPASPEVPQKPYYVTTPIFYVNAGR